MHCFRYSQIGLLMMVNLIFVELDLRLANVDLKSITAYISVVETMICALMFAVRKDSKFRTNLPVDITTSYTVK